MISSVLPQETEKHQQDDQGEGDAKQPEEDGHDVFQAEGRKANPAATIEFREPA
jgi:hypothetical protein